MNRIFLCVLVIVLFAGTRAQAQDFDATLARYSQNFQQEKAYLHYDKKTYAAGETIWFKAYLLEGINPAVSSKTFYVDWSDDKGNLVYRSVSPLVDATTNGQFKVPDDYTGRFIHLKAYTKWMLNFDTAFLYQQDIRIINTKSAYTISKTTVTPTLAFFPEGGDAIENMINKIAFKTNDQFGRPVNIKGVVQNQAGKVVDSLRIQHNGMGFFHISPIHGETYTAKWKDEKGKEYTTPLPAAKAEGVVLQVMPTGPKKFFTVNAAPGSSLKMVHVVGTMNQFEVFKLNKDISAGEIKGSIPVQSLPSGILTITVFNENYTPLAERILFVNNIDYLFQPEFTVEHWGLNKRARNDVSITVPDSLVASLSIAVTDADIDKDTTHNIVSDLLLTSDLRGQVFDPAYYLSDTSEKVSRDLDLVMMTHGWRRFNWADVAKNVMPVVKYKRDTAYMVLSGRVYGATPSQIKEAGNIILMVRQANSQGAVVTLPLDADGSFRDPGTILFDSATIFYQLQKAKGVSTDVSARFFEDKLSALVKTAPANGMFFNASSDTAGNYRNARFAEETARLLKKYEGQTLSTVVVKSKIKTPLQEMDEKYASGLFTGGDGYSFDLVNDPLARAQMNVFTYLQGKVAGLQVSNATSPTPSLSWRGGSPTLYLNEMPTDVSQIATMAVSDIAYIKVFRPPFMGGFNGANGAIAIYMRKGGDEPAGPGKGLAKNLVTGYTTLREFYSPNYETFNADNDKADIRTTLYWNPQVVTSPEANKVTLSFYNNDISRAFRVVIEGITTDGRLAHVEQVME